MNATPHSEQTQAKSREDQDGLLTLLQLEAAVRRVLEAEALPFFIVNETRRLLNYRQAILFSKPTQKPWQALALSSIAVVDRSTPMLQWLERALNQLYQDTAEPPVQRFQANLAPTEIAKDWAEFSLPYVSWCPLRTPGGNLLGGLWLARENPWQDHELALLTRLAETYAHAWQAIPKPHSTSFLKQRGVRYLGIGLFLCLLIPIRLSVLAPVEVIAHQPEIISAPLDGVIANIAVQPNAEVKVGQVLLQFEDTVLRNDLSIAEKSLAVAEAEHLRAMQAAFMDEKNKADVALLKARVDLARAELDFARDKLARIELKTNKSGIAIFRDSADWIGKPVKTGERIMEIANPSQMALRINLPVKEAIHLSTGAEVRAFFDADPLHPVPARVSNASYQAEVLPGDLLAYRLDAEISSAVQTQQLRIGWQGTAKLYAERVPLFYYLFRRPLSALRQYLGF